MTKEGAKLFVNSPNALAENNITKLDTSAADYVSENTANVDGVFETEEELLGMIRALVEVLPSCNLTTRKLLQMTIQTELSQILILTRTIQEQ